jgi:hypothetical protein
MSAGKVVTRYLWSRTCPFTVPDGSGTVKGQVLCHKERGLPIEPNRPVSDKRAYYDYSKQLYGAGVTVCNVQVQRKLYVCK